MPAPSGDLTADDAFRALEPVTDPELPFLSVLDLGIVRDVQVDEAGGVDVALTPTYSGCPATETIDADVARALRAAGFASVRVRHVLSPPWTTDWMTERAVVALKEHGIAPPVSVSGGRFSVAAVACPRCGSTDTACITSFGSTACKALYRCDQCLEPFDHFKCL
ncbi:MAG: 1,2-phenylacetyl-CoA epoxidase subunit PaaD [Myxococcota bacterium]